jgi:hypothetical protein
MLLSVLFVILDCGSGPPLGSGSGPKLEKNINYRSGSTQGEYRFLCRIFGPSHLNHILVAKTVHKNYFSLNQIY